jgi:predicted DNA-binding ribbon-helix-helix protein
MKSSVIKRSIVVNGHKTSVSLEDAFWTSLKDIARSRQARLTEHVAAIDAAREAGNLSSAIRLSVLDHYRQRAHPTTPQERPATSPPSGAKLVLVE